MYVHPYIIYNYIRALYLLSWLKYNQSKKFLHRRLYSKILKSRRPFYVCDVISDRGYGIVGICVLVSLENGGRLHVIL